MPGMKRFRRDGDEEPVSLDDEMFRLLPEDADPAFDADDRRGGGRPRDDLDYDDPDAEYGLDLDGDPAGRFSERRSVTTLLSALVVLVVVAGVVWYLVLGPDPAPPQMETAATTSGVTNQALPPTPTLPMVHADTEPYKIRPDDPGGLEVQNTDIHVYDRLGDSAEDDHGPTVEQLLPSPASPVSPPAPIPERAPAQPGVAAPVTPAVPAEPAAMSQESAGAGHSPSATEPAAQSAPSPATVPTPPAPASPPPPTPENVVVSALRGPQVQLAAFRDRAAAETAWARLSKAHPDILGPLPHAVVFADLGDLGKFYRLRAGPLASGNAAEQLCRSLKQRDVECLVVRE